MKTCTCPHEATRNGYMRTGYNSLCPFHGKPLPEVPCVPETMPAVRLPVAAIHITEAAMRCAMCEGLHADDVRCDFVDEN